MKIKHLTIAKMSFFVLTDATLSSLHSYIRTYLVEIGFVGVQEDNKHKVPTQVTRLLAGRCVVGSRPAAGSNGVKRKREEQRIAFS